MRPDWISVVSCCDEGMTGGGRQVGPLARLRPRRLSGFFRCDLIAALNCFVAWRPALAAASNDSISAASNWVAVASAWISAASGGVWRESMTGRSDGARHGLRRLVRDIRRLLRGGIYRTRRPDGSTLGRGRLLDVGVFRPGGIGRNGVGLRELGLPGEAADLDLDLLFELLVGFEGDDVVAANARGEIGPLQAINFRIVTAGKLAGGALPIGFLQNRKPEQVADPADAGFGTEEPVARYRRRRGRRGGGAERRSVAGRIDRVWRRPVRRPFGLGRDRPGREGIGVEGVTFEGLGAEGPAVEPIGGGAGDARRRCGAIRKRVEQT